MTIRREGNGFAALEAALDGLDGIEAKAGWFETAKYPNGLPVATNAFIHEHGALTGGGAVAAVLQGGEGPGARSVYIPPRPFMRPTVAAQTGAWMALLEQGAKAALLGSVTPRQAMESVVLKAAADVAKTIAAITEPPLSPATIRGKKGATKPLIDTGLMIQSVTGVVEDTK
jgi:hypothetical protein